MQARKIGYWVTTVLVALGFGAGGVFDFLSPPEVIEQLAHLGYPAYFGKIIGVWKILAVPALLAPRLPLLKEWAYAGIVFDLVGAFASHAYVGDGAQELLTPIVFLVVTGLSWALRPESRRLTPSPL